MNRFLIILIALLFIAPAVSAQFDSPPDRTNTADTLKRDDSGLFDKSNKNTFRVLFSGNPGRAALYSLILPGAGQFYNKRYWKIPLVYAGLGGVGYLLYENNKTYQEKKQEYIDNIDNTSSFYYQNYLITKKTREQSIFAVIGVYLFNVIDAYIDRHLIDFDMSDDISLQIKTYPDGIAPIGLSCSYYFE